MKYCAPEICDDRFWNGSFNNSSFPELLSKYFSNDSKENQIIQNMFIKIVKKYEKEGFEK